MVQARNIRIRLFDGEGYLVESEIGRYLHAVSIENLELVSIQYSYQAPEVRNDGGELAPATHGVCVVLAEKEECAHSWANIGGADGLPDDAEVCRKCSTLRRRSEQKEETT